MRRYRLFVLLLLTGWLTACSTPGAFFGATEGPLFQPRSLSDENRVLLYLYRPQSSWADQELEAPGLFINNQLFSGLPSGGYLVMELDTASYQLEIRRPLLGSYWTLVAESPMDFTRVASFALDAEAGGVFYLRYDELNPPPVSEPKLTQGDGPLQLAQLDVGTLLQEVSLTLRSDLKDWQLGAVRATTAQLPGGPSPEKMKRLCQHIWHEARPVTQGDEVDRYLRNRGRDGRIYWVSLEIQPLFAPDGTHQGFMAIEADITERRAAERGDGDRRVDQTLVAAARGDDDFFDTTAACRLHGERGGSFNEVGLARSCLLFRQLLRVAIGRERF